MNVCRFCDLFVDVHLDDELILLAAYLSFYGFAQYTVLLGETVHIPGPSKRNAMLRRFWGFQSRIFTDSLNIMRKCIFHSAYSLRAQASIAQCNSYFMQLFTVKKVILNLFFSLFPNFIHILHRLTFFRDHVPNGSEENYRKCIFFDRVITIFRLILI